MYCTGSARPQKNLDHVYCPDLISLPLRCLQLLQFSYFLIGDIIWAHPEIYFSLSLFKKSWCSQNILESQLVSTFLRVKMNLSSFTPLEDWPLLHQVGLLIFLLLYLNVLSSQSRLDSIFAYSFSYFNRNSTFHENFFLNFWNDFLNQIEVFINLNLSLLQLHHRLC